MTKEVNRYESPKKYFEAEIVWKIEQNGAGFYKPEHINTAIEAKDESEGEHGGSGEDNHYWLLFAPLWPVEESSAYCSICHANILLEYIFFVNILFVNTYGRK